MVAMAAATSGGPSKCRVALSVARLTCTLATPGSFFKARSTRPTHEAQVMPCTGRVTAAAVGAVTALAAVFMAVVPSVMRGL